MTSATLNTTIPTKAITIGNIAKFSEVDKLLFHNFEADRISDALRSTIRHMTLIILRSDTPTVANILITDVVLIALVVLRVLVALIVLIIEDSILPPTWIQCISSVELLIRPRV